jgi:hypothetical protein
MRASLSLVTVATLALSLGGSTRSGFAGTEGRTISRSTPANRLKLSVIRRSTDGSAMEVWNTFVRQSPRSPYFYKDQKYYAKSLDIKLALAHGYRITRGDLPASLATDAAAIAIHPWNPGQEHVLTASGSRAIATRIEGQITELMARANRLHLQNKVDLAALSRTRELVTAWEPVVGAFKAHAETLSKHNVEVLLDE